MEHDVVVIGAGLAGLMTAGMLVQAGRQVQVLEARERVGGRTFSPVIDDATFDLGGQWLGRDHSRLRALSAELGVAVEPRLPDRSLGNWRTQLRWHRTAHSDRPHPSGRYGERGQTPWISGRCLESAGRVIFEVIPRLQQAPDFTGIT